MVRNTLVVQLTCDRCCSTIVFLKCHCSLCSWLSVHFCGCQNLSDCGFSFAVMSTSYHGCSHMVGLLSLSIRLLAWVEYQQTPHLGQATWHGCRRSNPGFHPLPITTHNLTGTFATGCVSSILDSDYLHIHIKSYIHCVSEKNCTLFMFAITLSNVIRFC